MTDEQQKAAYIQAQIACMMVEMHGMVAENHMRMADNKALAYHYEDFMQLQNKYGVHHNAVVSFFGN